MTEVHKIDTRGPEVVSELQKLPSYTIGCVNWEEFPYRPEVHFRIGYSDDALAILFEVKVLYGRTAAANFSWRILREKDISTLN